MNAIFKYYVRLIQAFLDRTNCCEQVYCPNWWRFYTAD